MCEKNRAPSLCINIVPHPFALGAILGRKNGEMMVEHFENLLRRTDSSRAKISGILTTVHKGNKEGCIASCGDPGPTGDDVVVLLRSGTSNITIFPMGRF